MRIRSAVLGRDELLFVGGRLVQPGDLIVWGANKHIGIYLGGGMAISTLINPHGVSIHPVLGYLGMPVKAYLHVQLTR